MGHPYIAVFVTVFVPQSVAQPAHFPGAVTVTVGVVGPCASLQVIARVSVAVFAGSLHVEVTNLQTVSMGQFMMPVYGTVLVRVKHECSRLKVTSGALLSGSASATWLSKASARTPNIFRLIAIVQVQLMLRPLFVRVIENGLWIDEMWESIAILYPLPAVINSSRIK